MVTYNGIKLLIIHFKIGVYIMYSIFEKYLLKHFLYGILIGFLYALLLSDHLPFFYGGIEYLSEAPIINFLINILQMIFTIAILYTLFAVLYYMYKPKKY